jgi:RNA recognition motif-containing protein
LSVTEDDIRREFRRYGRILDVTIKSYYAFLHFEQEDSAIEAVKECDRVNVFG